MELHTGNLLIYGIYVTGSNIIFNNSHYIHGRYDGSAIIGYRLYREVTMLDSKGKSKGKGCVKLPPISFQWETLATNLEEFRKVAVSMKFMSIETRFLVTHFFAGNGRMSSNQAK